MKIAIDSETHPIKPGCVTPRLVCVSWADGVTCQVLNRTDGMNFVRATLADPRKIIVGSNIYYDLGVFCAEDPSLVPVVFQAFEDGRIRDVQVSAKMRDIAEGTLKFDTDDDGKAYKVTHSLASLLERVTGQDRSTEKMGLTVAEFLAVWPECHFGPGGLPYADWPQAAKDSPWRLRYSMLEGLAVADYPPPAVDYAMADASDSWALDDFMGPPIADELAQTRYQWAFTLMGIWGLRTDQAVLDQIKPVLEAEAAAASQLLIGSGFMRMVRKKNKVTGLMETKPGRLMSKVKDTVQFSYESRGLPVPMTEGTAKTAPTVSTAREVLQDSGHPDLMILAEVGATLKLLSKDIPQLELATKVPMHPKWNGLVETGRSSVSPNVQNLPRKGGIRECHIPRPGNVFVAVDFDTAELHGLAQACRNLLGYSTLGDLLNEGKDPHAALGATLMGVDYETMQALRKAGDKDANDYRQFAKIPNFGLPGGMGADSLILWAMSQLAELFAKRPELKAMMTREFAEKLIDGWHATFPEMREYFNWIKVQIGYGGEGWIQQLYSGRMRGRVPYCAACNTLFQGLVADAAKSALWDVSKASYAGPGLLFGLTRPVLFIHDEIISEVQNRDPELTSRIAWEKCRLMIAAAQPWMPDQKIGAKPIIMRRWFKGAEQVFNSAGLLVPGKPEIVNGKTKWVEDLA